MSTDFPNFLDWQPAGNGSSTDIGKLRDFITYVGATTSMKFSKFTTILPPVCYRASTLLETWEASLRPTVFDRDRASLYPTEFAQPLHKGSNPLAHG